MFTPRTISLSDGGMGESKDDVLEIVRERLAQKTLHVFNHEGLGAKFGNGTDKLGKHIPFVFVSPMLSPKGERLTGHTTGDEIDGANGGIVKLANVPLVDIPVTGMFDVPLPIEPECFA